MDILIPLMCVLALPVTIGLFLWRSSKREARAWRDLAEKYGWERVNIRNSPTQRGNSGLRGLYRGRKFSLLSERRGHRKSSTTVHVLRLELGDAMRNVALKSEGLGDKFLKLLGNEEEELGDAELDAALNLKQVTPEARAVLRYPAVRRRLLTMSERFRSATYWASFSISGGVFEAEFKQGTLGTAEQLHEAVSLVLNVADALDEAARLKARG